jgi:hypothetical protein
MKKFMEGNLSDIMLVQADYLERFPDDRHTFALPGEKPFFIEGRETVLEFAKGLRAMALERRAVELSQWN